MKNRPEVNHAFATPAWSRRSFLQLALAGGASLALAPQIWSRESAPSLARGVVFHDRDGDGRRGPRDRGIGGVAVSNGREVTLTDSKGRWELPLDGEATTFFVIKPRGWRTRRSAHNLSLNYYHHQPAGSPKQKYAGLAPTGPLPESIDFALTPQDEQDKFTALICGDPQPRNLREVGFLAQTVVPDLAGTRAAFGVSLGDIAFDNLTTHEPLVETFGLIGVPWHNVLGNHDLNYDARDNRHANESFKRVFGPTWFSFNQGPVHFIVLNNIEWTGADPNVPGSKGSYQGRLGERQLEFVANDLKHVPKKRLVVLLMHIPLHRGFDPRPSVETTDRQALYRLIEDRPYTVSFAAHTHFLGHVFLGADDGWRGAQPHHHIIAGALCGSWFKGAPDERGVPHGTMADGTPRGYFEVAFDGPRYSMDGYRTLGRPREDQMHIELPDEIAAEDPGPVAVFANVFNGTDRSMVKMRCGAGEEWCVMEKVEAADPRVVRLHERDKDLQPPLFPAQAPMPNCPHLWRAPLPEGLPPGAHLVEVMATDMFGQTHHGSAPVRVAS
jgi:hypothetical protein